ncbi:unnamed protein product [Lactuca virosa]|uniref:Uncharacterized protein n=1 Tax=Lactuca virosa TaxID=75947 RepID=A0AAU9NA35_9ASTR|nr:unnamed protein product [Lactuca virosa]
MQLAEQLVLDLSIPPKSPPATTFVTTTIHKLRRVIHDASSSNLRVPMFILNVVYDYWPVISSLDSRFHDDLEKDIAHTNSQETTTQSRVSYKTCSGEHPQEIVCINLLITWTVVSLDGEGVTGIAEIHSSIQVIPWSYVLVVDIMTCLYELPST